MKKSKKIQPIGKIAAIAAAAKKAGKKIVTTNGAFDLLHIGHVQNLQQAKKLGDILIVGVNSDASVRTHKHQLRPVIPEQERAALVAALEAVDYVFIFKTPGSIPWLEKIKPHVHAKGADRTLAQIPERETVEKHGGRVKLIYYRKGNSTTEIIKKIRQSDVE